MTTYIIYSDPNDGYLRSTNATLATAYAGSNLFVDTVGDTLYTGMNNDWQGTKYVYESFLSFDTSVITDTDEIVDATLTSYTGYPQNQMDAWGQQFLIYNWTAPLTTASWRTPAQLTALPLLCNNDYLFSSTPFTTRVTGRDTLRAGISKTAVTKVVATSNWVVEGIGYTSGVAENWIYSGNSTNKPYLTVFTTALNTLNSIGLATTSLPDGTTVSLRSNGAVTPVITVGYTPLNGTFTSLGTLSGSFAINIDGVNSLSLTSDPDGNFYILGTQFNVGGALAGQAWVRTGTTNVWTAKTPIFATMPQGNEQTITSTAVTYMEGGTDGNDKAAIYALASRGSGGNRPSFPYHVPGAGFTHDMSINVANLKNGSGWLLHGAVNGFGYTTATGIPAFVDMAKIGPNLNATYVQRGKFGNTTVGGLHVIGMYNTGGIIKGWNTDYISTGASKLVAISSNVFAHVYDSEGKNLTVRFYNARCQVLGETTLLASNFYGATIGTQWTAYYDKVANLVRVVYVAAATSRTLNRFDVSPVTFTGVSTLAITTTFGPSGAVHSFLRAAPTTDERFVPIESACNTAGVLSTQVYNSTVGNIAPSAPALTTRPNFDATSAAEYSWKFGDSNPADYQTAYQLEVSRVSDSVVVYDSGKIASAVESATLNPNYATRTNQILNPVPASTTGLAMTGGPATWSYLTNESEPYARLTKDGTTATTASYMGNATTLSIGTTVSLRFWIRASYAATIQLRNGGTAIPGETRVLVANTWTEITLDNHVTTIADFRLAYVVTSMTANSTFDHKKMIFETATTSPEYFSGASTDNVNSNYSWTGTANASTSTSVALNTMVNAINYRWRVRAYDVIDTAGTWSGYGTFTTAATGTLTITNPSVDNQSGIETSTVTVDWTYVQSGGATQTQRRVRVIRISDSAVIIDTTMQASTSATYDVVGLESGKEYRVEVSLVNSGAISVPVVSRLITPYYSEPMTPTLQVSEKESSIEVTVVNPTPTGDRPEVIFNDIYRRRSSTTATLSDFKRIVTVSNNATYMDFATKSGTSYDYQVVGRTN